MSWWIKRKDKDGKTHLWAVDVDPLFFMVLLGLLVGLILPNAHSPAFSRASITLMFSGFACFLISKISLFRRGTWVSWGASHMSKRYATLYRVGFGLVLLGIFFSSAVCAEIPLAEDLHERVVRVPLVLKDLFGENRLTLETTVYKPDGDGPFPLLILSHGTPPFGNRRFMGRTRYTEQSREFIKMGFVVAIPMRKGYGNSDGNPVAEKCSDYPHRKIGLDEAKSLLATVDYMKKEPFVDPKRVVFGGRLRWRLCVYCVFQHWIRRAARSHQFCRRHGFNAKCRCML